MTKLSKHFHDSEFKCPCCGKITVSGTLVSKLQELRDIINKPIEITSGYRCEKENKKVGGHPKSPHLPYYILVKGKKVLRGCLAADIQVKSMRSITLAMIACKIDGIRIGIYKNHLHIDVRPPNPSKYWLVKKYGQKAIYSGNEKNLAKFLKNNL